MNVLIFSFAKQGYQELCQIEAASEFLNRGDNVKVITCGRMMGNCSENRTCNRIQCSICKLLQIKRYREFLSQSVDVRSIDDYYNYNIKIKSIEFDLKYNTVEELRQVKYNGIEVGYGALSSYVSYTRNIDISIDEKMKKYFDNLIRMEIRAILAAELIIEEFKPDMIVVHNGRYAHYKPFYGLALTRNINYLITETITAADGTVLREFFNNAIPHDIIVKDSMIRNFWHNYPNVEDRDRVAISFYENRKNAKFAGDTIYVKDQVLGKLPVDWDCTKENIVIFNSSEDEYFSIGSEYDNYSLFKSQLNGIVTILEKYKNDSSKHFTIRVHPHLKDLPYSYHQDLYKLCYNNLTLIPADSDISSYSVLDAADKVVVFGSTMGIEAAFWGKPTINLAYALYEHMDVVYYPKSVEELFKLLNQKDLPAKKRQNTLMYGLYYISNEHKPFRYVNPQMKKLHLFGKTILYHPMYKLLGSSKLFAVFNALKYKIEKKISIMGKFKKIPIN